VNAPVDAKALLRAGLLEGVSVLCAGEHGPLGEEIARACAELGADVSAWRRDGEHVPADFLCYDGAGTYAAAAPDERGALDACLELAWEATRSVVAAPVLERHGDDGAHAETVERERGYPGRIVYVAPRPDAGAFARAAAAGLENLARTLSIEWARYGVSTVAIAPGAEVAPAEVAALAAYLASPAGGYFSGCLMDLTGPPISLPS
jgi:NAD(P)-dependent dehydrogenase (short-subunit alcohol dehydrogenase family)